MKHTKMFLLGLLMITFLGVSLASAQGNDPHVNPDRQMGPPQVRPDGFDAGTRHMDITGEITVEDNITISMTISPAADDIEQAQKRDHMFRPENFTNTIEVQITSLVEFEDTGLAGFDLNDTVVSEYLLNSDNIGDPVLTEDDNGDYYEITSDDGIFYMIIYLRTEDGVARSWKWSIEINYPFISSTSNLAVLQSVESNMGRIAHHHRYMNYQNPPEHALLNQSRIEDGHENLPMFFKWDDYATVDGVNETVVGTMNNGDIAFSLPQGSEIFYDPEIGVDVETITSLDNVFDGLLTDFLNSLNSPTVVGLVIAASIISITVIVSRVRPIRK